MGTRLRLTTAEQVSTSKGKKKEAEFCPKKLPPPTPDRREGRLFPPEQS
jgi:hypothetical protein